ncbi:MAG TPA: potassium channel family protein [Acidimicrobiia bacterium]|nr:potassium channel family protein [Acidimicrobiia bacterium]
MATPRGPDGRLGDRYLLALALIVVTIIAYTASGDGGVGQIFVVVLQGMTVLVIFRASIVSARMFRIVAVLVIVSVVATVLSVATDSRTAGAGLAGALLAFVAPIAIARRMRSHLRIDLTTVTATLCIYLLVGLFFAHVFGVIDIVDGPFFVQPGAGSAIDFVYFSFTTLTTLGYGDLTARLDLGRMLAIIEALIGQLYLVSVVALVVGNLGRTRRSATDEGLSE